ncbi:hypothetical protein [Allocoleopsis franciscana]|uniref:Outer membrane protein beta-barrel domain-containing protein n=1 Tax=Allocoleopsis franciscana PCC 7113 TaxID=1173027 RepID=K9WN36_9CYAN|nr:hypothetical protein [Allocoleopsis franciscana]AFZ20967.1 hypothetical protein Mic7113_5318 [Allocoleopsis franciscana PCC 7113]
MRFPTVAFCTLTVLLAGGLTAQASDSITSEESAPKSVISEATSETSSITSKETEATAKLDQGQAVPITLQSEVQALKSDHNLTNLSTPDVYPSGIDNTLNAKSSLVAQRENGTVISNAEALRPDAKVAQPSTTNSRQLVAEAKPEAGANCIAMANTNGTQIAQGAVRRCPRPVAVPKLIVPEIEEESGASPALSIYIPVGYGADKNTVFLGGTYQPTVRDTTEDDEGSVGTGGIGVGLGDADKAVGVELSYTFETTNDSFGEGGFNAKLHRRLGQDLSVAVGGNGLVNIGRNDFEQSKYGVITKVFRTQDSLNKPFSRVAFTVGVGDGQYRSNGAVKAGDNNANVFGNMAVRVARPVSFIAEWTGTDLGLGVSIAPFRNIPFVITPAVRDLVGAGDAPRFVLGAGTAFRF